MIAGQSKTPRSKAVYFFHCVIIGTLALLSNSWTFAAESICAKVKIQIQQKASLERQAFDAKMSIDNGLDIPIENVSVSLNFKDASGTSVIASSDANNTSALFFIAAPTLTQINAVDGSGSVAAHSNGQIEWLLIPAAGTGGLLPQGKLYFVGASLTYKIGIEIKTVDVMPDSVTVLPQPLLVLDYFLATDVYADDAFTDAVEPAVPFTLGVRIKNVGGGKAMATKIESGQPKIVENKQGLLIGFQIIDSFINDAPAEQSLLRNFGEIAPAAAAVGRWNMVTTLSGKFTDFTATFTHSDALGGALTSLIDKVSTHPLIHDVKVDVPGRDTVRDFLARDGAVLRVYESDGLDSVVTDQSAAATLLIGTGDVRVLNFPATTGFSYVKLLDPHAGQSQPGTVVRSDGKVVPVENIWLSKTRNDDLSWSY